MQPPTPEQVGRARPPRGNGAPSRCKSHKERILVLLKERGPAGVLSSELYDSPKLYGRSPRNRISEMRRDGCLIETVPAGIATVRYTLLRDESGTPPARNPSPPPTDWYTAQTGKTRPPTPQKPTTTDMPLFEVRQ
jgi:hypothetical protein